MSKAGIVRPKSSKGFWSLDTKELALVSVLSSLWIVSQIYLGPIISQITHVHGVVQRLFGWFLMVILVGFTGRFGRVTLMASISSAATRMIRPGRLYAIFVGLGYALGGFTFDLLYHMAPARMLRSDDWTAKLYISLISAVSGVIASIPYILFKLSFLGPYGFTLWLPFYMPRMFKGVALSILGGLVGITILPKIENLKG